MHKGLPRTAVVLTALLLSGAVVFNAPSAAVADDDVVSSYPTADSTISGSPDEISLMFAGTLNNAGADDATVIKVLDERGEDVAVDPPTVSGQSITQHLSTEAADGVFTVRWKAVSGDGHPISGQFSYTVGQLGLSSGTAPPGTSSPRPSPQESENATEEEEPAPARQTYGGTPSGGAAFEMLPMFFVGGLAAILVFGVVGVVLAGRRRHQQDSSQAAGDSAAAEEGYDA